MKALKTFFEKVDKRSRKAMTDFLIDHERYDTMNSWNRATSWANNVKVHNVIPRALLDKVFEMMECEDFYDSLNQIIRDYNEENNYYLQAGFNGRSGGYLVMYEGGRKVSDHKSYCTECYQRNFKTVEESGNVCGRCGKPARKNHTFYETFSYPGRSVDSYDESDYEEMSMSELKEIVEKVQRFDKLCDDIVAETIYMAENNDVEDEEYTVTKTRKIMV